MTARKANPKPRVGIIINYEKSLTTVQATRPYDEVQRMHDQCSVPRLATSSTDSIFERPTYTPSAHSYQRNTGHSHIASRGVRC